MAVQQVALSGGAVAAAAVAVSGSSSVVSSAMPVSPAAAAPRRLVVEAGGRAVAVASCSDTLWLLTLAHHGEALQQELRACEHAALHPVTATTTAATLATAANASTPGAGINGNVTAPGWKQAAVLVSEPLRYRGAGMRLTPTFIPTQRSGAQTSGAADGGASVQHQGEPSGLEPHGMRLLRSEPLCSGPCLRRAFPQYGIHMTCCAQPGRFHVNKAFACLTWVPVTGDRPLLHVCSAPSHCGFVQVVSLRPLAMNQAQALIRKQL
jgi:hypothetical protein